MGSTKEPLMFLVISPCCKGFINSGVLGLSWSWEEKYDEKTHYHFLNYFHWWYSQRLMKINGIKASRSNLTYQMETSLPMECNSCRCCWVLSCCRGWSSIIRGPSTSSLPSFDVRRSFHSSDCLGTGWCFLLLFLSSSSSSSEGSQGFSYLGVRHLAVLRTSCSTYA